MDRQIQVMEPVAYDQVFDDDAFLYQVKWDGVRMLAFLAGTQVTLINKHHNDRTSQYIELQGLPGRVEAETAVLDGEIVVMKNGKPSFPAVMSRDRLSQPARIEFMQTAFPVNYMVFDLLYLNGDKLIDQPLEYRQALLRERVNPCAWLHLVEDFTRGSALFDSVCSLDLEGIVAKSRQSRYIGGKKHRDWLKIKYRRRQSCLVGGYTLRGRMVNSLLLGIYQQNDFIYIGRVSSGLTGEHETILSQYLPTIEMQLSPFTNLVQRPATCHFIEPAITVEVEFQEWTEELRLRSPVLKSFITEPAEGVK